MYDELQRYLVRADQLGRTEDFGEKQLKQLFNRVASSARRTFRAQQQQRQQRALLQQHPPLQRGLGVKQSASRLLNGRSLPPVDVALEELLGRLSPHVIVHLFAALLTESSIICVSRHMAVIPDVLEVVQWFIFYLLIYLLVCFRYFLLGGYVALADKQS